MNMATKIKTSLKQINFKLFLALLLMGLIPAIYTTVRIFFLGSMPDEWGFSIASQLSWVNLLYEILQESIILPLFYFIGEAYKNNRADLQNRVRTGLLVTFVVYALMSAIIMIFAEPMVKFMAQDSTLISQTVAYIRLETIANIFATMVKFLIVVLVTIEKERNLYAVLGLQMVLSISLDTFFISSFDFSLQLGVNGIAYTNIIVNMLLLALVIAILKREQISVFAKERMNFAWMKSFFVQGGISGLETLVRNVVFMLMIVRMVNVVGEQGTFWVANNFIWGWLLLPVLQLGELVKRDCGEGGMRSINEKFIGYVSLTTAIVVIWLITIPLWKPFIQNIMNVADFQAVYEIVIISLGFYMLFAYNNIIDSIFYGLGKTKYMLYQSIAINTIFYGAMFILCATGIYQPTLIKIAIMFATGTALDSLLSFWIYKKVKTKL